MREIYSGCIDGDELLRMPPSSGAQDEVSVFMISLVSCFLLREWLWFADLLILQRRKIRTVIEARMSE